MIPPHSSNNIDTVRILLAVLVLFSHSYDMTLRTNEQEPLKLLTLGQMSFGELAVNGFFVLSGYLVSQSQANSSSAGSFLRKRICRILPGYWVATAICLLVVAPLAGACNLEQLVWDNGWRALLLRGIYAPTAFATNPYPGALNGSLWSISYEWWCYVGLLALGLSVVRYRSTVIVALFSACLAAGFFCNGSDLRWPTGGRLLGSVLGSPVLWLRLLPMFLAGMTAYTFRSYLVFNRVTVTLAIAGLAIASRTPDLLCFAMPTLGAYLLFYIAFESEIGRQSASMWGDPSYGIYLYAFPIQQLIVSISGSGLTPVELFLLALLPTIAAGFLSWHLIEKRFVRRRSR